MSSGRLALLRDRLLERLANGGQDAHHVVDAVLVAMEVGFHQPPHAKNVDALEVFAELGRMFPIERRGELREDRVGTSDALAGATAIVDLDGDTCLLQK